MFAITVRVAKSLRRRFFMEVTGFMRNKLSLSALLFGTLVLLTASVAGQAGGPQYQKQESSAPVLTGFVGFGSSFEPGQQQLLPTFAPILLVPLGDRILIEAEPEFEGTYNHRSGQPWSHTWEKGIEYAQADVFVNRYVTLVGGRFLTPFGIYNERLHSGWIRNLQTAPFITAFEASDSNGGMVRGAIPLNGTMNVNYSGFYSVSSDTAWFLSDRAAGGRVGFFLPRARLEVGASFQRKLGDERRNLQAADFTWQLKPIPLDVRGEFARDPVIGKGYWIEGAYRMGKVPFLKAFMKKSQAEVRMEQFWVSPLLASATDTEEIETPTSDAKRVFAGWSYWIRPDIRTNFAYGREFNSTDGNRNLWTMGLTYRFAFPLTGGK